MAISHKTEQNIRICLCRVDALQIATFSFRLKTAQTKRCAKRSVWTDLYIPSGHNSQPQPGNDQQLNWWWSQATTRLSPVRYKLYDTFLPCPVLPCAPVSHSSTCAPTMSDSLLCEQESVKEQRTVTQ
ncbi:hypothetical protein J6590_070785 [Homalodisca vitripennis]|nr:hypothetical protein J6590_070785 [Homalodisca vitripennis]